MNPDKIDAAKPEELRDEVRRLRGINERNASSFEDVKKKGNDWRDRALAAEAKIEELQKIAGVGRQPSDVDLLFEALKRFVKRGD